VNNLRSRWSEIARGFRFFFFFSAILTLTLHASGSTGQLTVNPSNINFGNVPVGGSQTQSVTLTNSGNSNLTITQATPIGRGFSLSDLSYPVTLAGGHSVTCNVTFTPPSAGTDRGSVWIAFNTQGSHNGGNHSPIFTGSPSVTLPLAGTGVIPGQLTANPTSLGFGSVPVGNSQTMTETLTNSGGSSLTISAVTDSGSGFSVSGLALPLTLNAGQSTPFTVLFSPTTSGAASGAVSITSTASNLSIPLSGTGVTQGALTANPTSLAFGSVQVGSSAQKYRQLRPANSGNRGSDCGGEAALAPA
jgi:Abnormal spindle-like microcephaly-assoc'd, ASPM-SPD-2-Hydin